MTFENMKKIKVENLKKLKGPKVNMDGKTNNINEPSFKDGSSSTIDDSGRINSNNK